MRVTEVDAHLRGHGDLGVLSQFGALVPGQGLAQVLGQGLDGGQKTVADRDRTVALGQVDQHREPGLSLDEGGDGRATVRPQDQIALPMSWHGPVGNLGGSLADQDHVRDLARGALHSRASRASHGPAGAQVLVQVSTQMATALDIQRLVDRLGAHLHLLPGHRT